MLKSKYERLPRAGDYEKENGLEIIYLSPKPIPTGMPALKGTDLFTIERAGDDSQ